MLPFQERLPTLAVWPSKVLICKHMAAEHDVHLVFTIFIHSFYNLVKKLKVEKSQSNK
jgi:hypothetical protein